MPRLSTPDQAIEESHIERLLDLVGQAVKSSFHSCVGSTSVDGCGIGVPTQAGEPDTAQARVVKEAVQIAAPYPSVRTGGAIR